jgi:phytanoyl-CoA hydroxylase
MALTREQVQLFRHNGFLRLPTKLPEAQVETLKRAILSDVDEVVEPVVRNGAGRVVRLSRLLDRDPIFRETVSSSLVLDPLESLLGPNIEVVLNRHNHATLNLADKPDSFHQDNMQWTRALVTVIFFLEETTLENGCTMMIPGTHLLPGAEVRYRLDESQWIAESGLLEQAVPVPMPAGGLLAIDSLIFHRIGINQTESSRMSMTVGYHSVDEFAGVEDPKRWLVRGERVYKGNDKK